MKKSICFILGTRPEIIKIAPVIKACSKLNLPFYIIHTNQHYSPYLDEIFFNELSLPKSNYNLNVGSHPHGKQTALILEKVEGVLALNKTSIVLVQGDTNTVLGGALAASKLKIPIGHIEAGLRSFDKSMPEEINRIVTDHISDLLFAPTKGAIKNLENEGIHSNKINYTGNTIVDAVYQNIVIAENKQTLREKLKLKTGGYYLLTLHRAENTDDKKRLTEIFEGFERIGKVDFNEILFPCHPRTQKKINEYNINIPSNVSLIEPVGYFDFLILQKEASLIFTDSGGGQEEACILKVPCITLRNNTERPETLKVGANILAGNDTLSILDAFNKMKNIKNNWENPFGDGTAGERIAELVKTYET